MAFSSSRKDRKNPSQDKGPELGVGQIHFLILIGFPFANYCYKTRNNEGKCKRLLHLFRDWFIESNVAVTFKFAGSHCVHPLGCDSQFVNSLE